MWYFLSQKVYRKIFTDCWKVLVLNFSMMGNMAFFWGKELMEKMIFIDEEKVLVLNFSVVRNTVFFESRSWWKDYINWLRKSSCFELFGDGKYDLFFKRKVDGKMILTWSFWAFHDIPAPGKYGFSCSGRMSTGIWENLFKSEDSLCLVGAF